MIKFKHESSAFDLHCTTLKQKVTHVSKGTAG